jgi:hypothetical protein
MWVVAIRRDSVLQGIQDLSEGKLAMGFGVLANTAIIMVLELVRGDVPYDCLNTLVSPQ